MVNPYSGRHWEIYLVNNLLSCTHSSSVIQSIQDLCDLKQSTAYAYFFFDGRHADQRFQEHNGLIRSLLRQIIHQCHGLPMSLLDLYNSCSKGYSQPSINALSNTLLCLMHNFDHLYVIIDSADECNLDERFGLLQWVSGIVSEKVGGLHLMISGRPLRDIEDGLGSLKHIPILVTEESGNHDIEKYLAQMFQVNVKLKRWDAETREHVKAVLLQKAEGM